MKYTIHQRHQILADHQMEPLLQTRLGLRSHDPWQFHDLHL